MGQIFTNYVIKYSQLKNTFCQHSFVNKHPHQRQSLIIVIKRKRQNDHFKELGIQEKVWDAEKKNIFFFLFFKSKYFKGI